MPIGFISVAFCGAVVAEDEDIIGISSINSIESHLVL